MTLLSRSPRLALATFLGAALLVAAPLTSLRAADLPMGPIGEFNPEQPCDGPVSNPVCTYKTWFFCRVADQDDMCKFVLGKGPQKKWEDRPWLLPLSQLIAGPLGIYGYAFIGSLKVDDVRLANASPKIKRQLMGSYEVMDTYADPQTPGVAYVGSEFYAETKRGEWHIVGWSLTAEGGDAPNECQDAQNVDKDICKLRVEGLPSWLQMMRGPAKK
jgi:hypothetical protein